MAELKKQVMVDLKFTPKAAILAALTDHDRKMMKLLNDGLAQIEERLKEISQTEGCWDSEGVTLTIANSMSEQFVGPMMKGCGGLAASIAMFMVAQVFLSTLQELPEGQEAPDENAQEPTESAKEATEGKVPEEN